MSLTFDQTFLQIDDQTTIRANSIIRVYQGEEKYVDRKYIVITQSDGTKYTIGDEDKMKNFLLFFAPFVIAI
jgi:hypothetical protein